MSFTLTTAQAEISYRLRDPNNVLLPSAQALELLNRGCKDFARRTRGIPFDRTVTVTVADNNELSVTEATLLGTSASKILALDGVWWNVATTSAPQYQRLSPKPLADLLGIVDGGTWMIGGQPMWYAMERRTADLSGTTTTIARAKMYLMPTPGSTNSPYTNLLRIMGTRTHTDTGSMGASDVLEFPEELHEGPILWAVWKGLERDGAFEQAGVVASQYMEMVQQANTARDQYDDMPRMTQELGLYSGDYGED